MGCAGRGDGQTPIRTLHPGGATETGRGLRVGPGYQQKGHAKGFPTLCFMDTTEVGGVITCDGVQKVMADEYGLTMPYRSPIQNVKRMVKAVAGVVKALLRALGVGAAKTK